MRGYGQFCPVAQAAEIVAERWAPLVLRELLCGGRRFGDLHRGVPLMSRALLAKRLAELEDAGIIRSGPRRQGRGREYQLTAAGEELRRRSAPRTSTRGCSCGTSTGVSTWTPCRPAASSSASTSGGAGHHALPADWRGGRRSCGPSRRGSGSAASPGSSAPPEPPRVRPRRAPRSQSKTTACPGPAGGRLMPDAAEQGPGQ
ncbi:MAG TPA: helix-turn-helix domain-containing protein, partial [Candidatus Binatia bacterium]|nr:helix-turn-helix domain-containing protein [Candidatus Binatia bacterium]